MLSGIRDFNALTDKLGDNNGYAPGYLGSIFSIRHVPHSLITIYGTVTVLGYSM